MSRIRDRIGLRGNKALILKLVSGNTRELFGEKLPVGHPGRFRG